MIEDRGSRIAIFHPPFSILGFMLTPELSRNTQPHPIDPIARRDKKGPPIRIAPVEVSRVAWDFKAAKKIPFGVDHMNTGRPCAVDVPLAIHFHPVGIPRFVTASIIEQPSIAQGPIG